MKSLILSVALDRSSRAEDLALKIMKSCNDREEAVNWILRNGVSLLFSELTDGFSRLSGDSVELLKRSAREESAKALHMADLIERASSAFEENGIDYVIFKTFNRAKRIDVDVDIVIPRHTYWEAVRLLLKNGFKPVDDLLKTYATGFMLPGNPIVLDLHTEITVLGIPYFRSELLLENRERVKHTLGGVVVETYTPRLHIEAAVRIAHTIIKEAEIRIDDVTEILNAISLSPAEVREALADQNLKTSYNICVQALTETLSHLEEMPYRLSEALRLRALIDVARKSGIPEVAMSLGNVRYRRNATMIGKTIMSMVRQI